MTRILISVLTLGLVSAACSSDGSLITGPTAISAITASGSSEGFAEKYYTVGGIVQSIEKPLKLVNGARIDAFGAGNEGRSTTSGSGGAFSLAVKPGTLRLVISKPGYQAWSTDLTVYGSHGDMRVMLQPER